MGGTVPSVTGDREQVIEGGEGEGRGGGWTDRGDFGLQKSNICKIRFRIFKTYMS